MLWPEQSRHLALIAFHKSDFFTLTLAIYLTFKDKFTPCYRYKVVIKVSIISYVCNAESVYPFVWLILHPLRIDIAEATKAHGGVSILDIYRCYMGIALVIVCVAVPHIALVCHDGGAGVMLVDVYPMYIMQLTKFEYLIIGYEFNTTFLEFKILLYLNICTAINGSLI